MDKFDNKAKPFKVINFRAHASRIMNVISSIVDSLDKDPELVAIKKIIAECELKYNASFGMNYLTVIKYILEISVGKTHSKRQISKKAFVELREVLVDVLSEVCRLDDEGN